MAEEAQYNASTTDTTPTTTMKRKYEEQTTPPPQQQSGTRRTTGFSAPITSSPSDLSNQAPPSYNSVPPPLDDIQIAKQRAQEIAARLFNSASSMEAKRPRADNGPGFDSGDIKGFSSIPSDVGQKASMQIPVSYGYNQGSTKKIDIPNGKVGVIIGKAGDTIKYLQLQSGAKIQVTRDADADPNSLTRAVEIVGTSEQIAKAEQLITDVLAEAEAGGGGNLSQGFRGNSGSGDKFVMQIPNNKVGLVIGKGGETIKNMQARTGARIQVIPLHLPPGDTSQERTVQIDGTNEQIESAKLLVNEVISENRARNSSMGGGGYSQQGYQARPPATWAPPPPMQQQYGGYVQPGAYPGPTPQYQQQSYGGYPSQPNSGGYPSNWDPTTAPPTQQPAQGTGYDYYNQQPSTQQQQPQTAPASTDNAAYNYNQQQQPASGYNQQGGQQGYAQDGYGNGYNAPAPQSGYNNQQQSQGYDQQQGYNAAPTTHEGSTPAYGTPQVDSAQTAPPAPQQGYGSGQQPSPNSGSYPSQAGYGQSGYGAPQPAQSGYGQPQTQKPPVYGQTSPIQQQGGYPQQSGYSQAGYAPPPYGTAGGYGQQQPGPYNSYGGGGNYQQQPPTAYSAADASVGGPTTTPSVVPKASPQS